MEWVRGDTVGHGSFGTVNLALPRSQSAQIPPLMAVKSCGFSHSASLMNEKSILYELRDCPQVIRCFGDSFSFENGEKLYNVLLEYASGGALADKLKNSGEHCLPEFDVRRYTKSILRGLHYIHKYGYVHCDIKLQNILLSSSKDDQGYVAKIADFGLAKRAGVRTESSRFELRGTPMCMSPEMVAGGEQESAADIWALGCVVAEMLTGAPAWRCREGADVRGLLMRIGVGDEVPEIPGKLSDEGKDFLRKCFLKDPRKRWTAEMLLKHPFVIDNDDDRDTVTLDDKDEIPSTSPRGPFDFTDWVYLQSLDDSSITSLLSPENSPQSDTWFEGEQNSGCGFSSSSPADRLGQLASKLRPDWSASDSWITVR